uniref:Uncharacterized protein n=1 Tax=Rhizophora mucronata TaxID=61149 RepID=A0A2P2JNU0_RHIMU
MVTCASQVFSRYIIEIIFYYIWRIFGFFYMKPNFRVLLDGKFCLSICQGNDLLRSTIIYPLVTFIRQKMVKIVA